jgi:hypothetical protein
MKVGQPFLYIYDFIKKNKSYFYALTSALRSKKYYSTIIFNYYTTKFHNNLYIPKHLYWVHK